MPFAFNPSGEQSSVCLDVTMKCGFMMTLVRTQVRALDFKRNQRWKLCSTASIHVVRILAVSFDMPCDCSPGDHRSWTSAHTRIHVVRILL